MTTPRLTFVHMQQAALWRKEKQIDKYVDPVNGEVSFIGLNDAIRDPVHWENAPKEAKARPNSPFKKCKPNKAVPVEYVSRKKSVKS